MINHFLITLYNHTDANSDGVHNPLSDALRVPGVVDGFLRGLQGNSAESAWDFAKSATKIVAASTWETYLTLYDTRLTTDYYSLRGLSGNRADLVARLASARGDVVQALVNDTPLIKKSLVRGELPQEKAAAVLVGLVGYITANNEEPAPLQPQYARYTFTSLDGETYDSVTVSVGAVLNTEWTEVEEGVWERTITSTTQTVFTASEAIPWTGDYSVLGLPEDPEFPLIVGPLPATGQTAVIRSGDDGFHQEGFAWPIPRLVDNSDGTVTDNLTGLMWICNVNHLGIKMNWASALAACESETFAGHSDWRMPNMRELVSLGRNYGFYQPSIPAEFFGASLTNRTVWTSTTLAYDPASAVQQEIWSGQYQQPSTKTATQCVMLVRSVVAEPNVLKTGQITSYADGDDGYYQIGKAIPSPRFVDNGNGTVTDMLTNLVWLKNSGVGRFKWSECIDRCNALADGQHGLSDGSVAGDWRLPNLFELHSLTDMSNSNSATTLALPTGHPFTVIPLAHYGYYSSTYMTGWAFGNLRQSVHMSRGYASYSENVEGASSSGWGNIWAVRNQ